MNNKIKGLLLNVLEYSERTKETVSELTEASPFLATGCFKHDMKWETIKRLENCTVKNDVLYNSDGDVLATDGLVNNLYFCKVQAYNGFIYFPIDDNGGYVCLYYEY